jgi:hypothetical protein
MMRGKGGSIGSARTCSIRQPKKLRTLPLAGSLSLRSLKVVAVQEPSVSTQRSLSVEEMTLRVSKSMTVASNHVCRISSSWGSAPAISASLVNAENVQKRVSHTSGRHAFCPQAGAGNKKIARFARRP